MITYNPKDWFTFIFRLHKSDTIRKLLPMIIAMGIYGWLIAYLELEYWDIADNDYVKILRCYTIFLVLYFPYYSFFVPILPMIAGGKAANYGEIL